MDKFFPNKQLKLLIDTQFGGKVTELTKILQISRQSIDDYLNMKSAIGNKFKKRLIELAGINQKWLDFGEGEMFNKQATSPTATFAETSGIKHQLPNINEMSKEEKLEFRETVKAYINLLNDSLVEDLKN